MLQKNGIRPESMFLSNDVYATVSMVRAGMGAAFLNGIGCEFVDQSVCVRKLEQQRKMLILLGGFADKGMWYLLTAIACSQDTELTMLM